MSSSPSLATVLTELEDELFYAVLDVSMDIDQVLTVESGDVVRISGIRDVVRYRILYPVHSVDSAYRYLDLRKKGLKVLGMAEPRGTSQYVHYE